MRYHQLSEVFDHLVKLNGAILDFYERSLEVTKQERVRIFLHYLIDKQKFRKEHLINFLADGPVQIFDLWFYDELDTRLLVFIEKLAPAPDASTDEVLKILTEFNERIEIWLQIVLSTVTNEHANEYLQNLIDYLHHANQQVMHAVQRMDDW